MSMSVSRRKRRTESRKQQKAKQRQKKKDFKSVKSAGKEVNTFGIQNEYSFKNKKLKYGLYMVVIGFIMTACGLGLGESSIIGPGFKIVSSSGGIIIMVIGGVILCKNNSKVEITE